MAKNDVSVSNNFYKAVAKKSLHERIYQAEETKSLEEFREKKNNAKCQKRSENIEAAREYEKKSNPEHIRNLNRKA